MQFNIFKAIIAFNSAGKKVDEDTNTTVSSLCRIRNPALWISLPMQVIAHFDYFQIF